MQSFVDTNIYYVLLNDNESLGIQLQAQKGFKLTNNIVNITKWNYKEAAEFNVEEVEYQLGIKLHVKRCVVSERVEIIDED